MLTFTLPPGIGDCSWVISKIHHLFQKREVAIKLCDWAPPRSKPFIDLLPVKNLGYTRWDFPRGALPITTDLDSLEDGNYFIECNTALESGKKLKDIFPQQPTNYHYPIEVPEIQKGIAQKFLNKATGYPRIGIYAASYRGTCPWSIEEWVSFCRLLRRQFPDTCFYVIGATWDDRTRDLGIELAQQGYNTVSAVGEHLIGTTIEVIRGLDYFFAFPSGLGILADVVNTPCLMWIYRDFPQRLIGSYQDPEGKHITVGTRTPLESFHLFKESLA